MIYHVEGDILLTRQQAIAHGVAPNDPMNSGLARSLHEKYPAMHKDFHHWCHQKHPKPGEVWMWGGVGGVRLVNLLTQGGGYGHGSQPGKATLANVKKCCRALVKLIETEGLESVAMPRLATGVGGLEWDDVYPIIEKTLGDIPTPVFVYSCFREGVKGDESKARLTGS